MSEHTKEPWQVDAMGNLWADTKICNMREIADRAEVYRPMMEPEHRANARRIVACVNACAGIDTVTLESLVSTGNPTLKNCATALLQRDQLLAALKEAKGQVEELCLAFNVPLPDASIERYSGAIQSIEGPMK